MKPPIFVIDGLDVQLCWTVEELVAHLEPPEVKEGESFIADAEGRLIKLEVVTSKQSYVFGLLTVDGDEVVLRDVEAEPKHGEQLRAALADHLAGVEPASSESVKTASLEELVQKVIARKRPVGDWA